MKTTRSTGRQGEEAPCRYLIEQGYRIVARNLYFSHNEIDIIAEDEDFLVFVEVKSRRRPADVPDRYGRPANAVSDKKQKSILKAATEYLRQTPTSKRPRIDVIEVYLEGRDKTDIRHIRNAFYA